VLLPEQDARVTAALAVAARNLAEADQLASGPMSYVRSAWAWLLGSNGQSIGNNATNNAANTRTLYEVLAAKADRWRSSSIIVEDIEVADLEQAAGASSNEGTKAQAELLSPMTALKQTLGPIADPSAWPPWLKSLLTWLAVGAVVLLVLPYVVGAVVRSLAGRK
jgi:hypothetical protein